MHRKQQPKQLNVIEILEQFPHCDSRVLHAPGECEYCDEKPTWQALRQAWGIAFTGYVPDEKELPCPATVARPLGTINRWSGNTAKPMVCGFCELTEDNCKCKPEQQQLRYG